MKNKTLKTITILFIVLMMFGCAPSQPDPCEEKTTGSWLARDFDKEMFTLIWEEPYDTGLRNVVKDGTLELVIQGEVEDSINLKEGESERMTGQMSDGRIVTALILRCGDAYRIDYTEDESEINRY